MKYSTVEQPFSVGGNMTDLPRNLSALAETHGNMSVRIAEASRVSMEDAATLQRDLATIEERIREGCRGDDTLLKAVMNHAVDIALAESARHSL